MLTTAHTSNHGADPNAKARSLEQQIASLTRARSVLLFSETTHDAVEQRLVDFDLLILIKSIALADVREGIALLDELASVTERATGHAALSVRPTAQPPSARRTRATPSSSRSGRQA